MPCTTILAGKNATYDGSTMMARNEDCGSGRFMPKKFVCVRPEDQPRHYKSVLTGFEMDLDEEPMRYTAVPNAPAFQGIWGESGVNSLNVAMTETETITSNGRVLGADPLVKNGVGEEDMLTVVLPYIRSAREGVLRLGGIIEIHLYLRADILEVVARLDELIEGLESDQCSAVLRGEGRLAPGDLLEPLVQGGGEAVGVLL